MEKRYAKIEGGYLMYPPYVKDNILNYHLNTAMLQADGYKEIIEDPYPNDGNSYLEEYIDEGNVIRRVWLLKPKFIDVMSIDVLKRELSDLDYLTLKNIEAERCGKPLPVPWSEIELRKQPLRDKIRELEGK